jgi:hypothetical protein
MGKAEKQKRNLAIKLEINKAIKERNYTRMVIRRESDDKHLEVNWADDNVAEQIEDFCKGTNGRVASAG